MAFMFNLQLVHGDVKVEVLADGATGMIYLVGWGSAAKRSDTAKHLTPLF